jgi:uncharacterized ferredoxin-like protein
MPNLESQEIEQKGVLWAAYLMAVSARTAPKACAVDNIVTSIIEDEEGLETLAQAMENKCEHEGKFDAYLRDANNVRQSSAALLIGAKGTMPKTPERPLNCGACGYKSCENFIKAPKKMGEDFVGPICLFNALDLGIALGSAVKMAADLNIDNRMFYTMGASAKELGLLNADVIIGILLSVSGKNIFYDRTEIHYSDKAAIRLPYDSSHVPEKGEVLIAMDRSGNVICDAIVERVAKTKSKTSIISVIVPRNYVMAVRHLKVRNSGEQVEKRKNISNS